MNLVSGQDLVTQWVMDEITAYDVHDRGEDKGMVHAGLNVTGAQICTFIVLLVAQMKDTCNYGEELEAKYATVAIAYMNGFAQGAGFHPDFKIQEDCVDAFNGGGLGVALTKGFCANGDPCQIGSICSNGGFCCADRYC